MSNITNDRNEKVAKVIEYDMIIRGAYLADVIHIEEPARDMIHVLECKGIDVSSLLSEREKRERKKTSSLFLADIDVGLSCVEFISAHLCPACGYCVDNLESNEKVYTLTAMFGRCDDPVEPHYVAKLELMCKTVKP